MLRFFVFIGLVISAGGFVLGPHNPKNTGLKASAVQQMPSGYDPLEASNYIAMGVATWYQHGEDNTVSEVLLIEPLTAGTLETLGLQVPTSYRRVLALTCGDLFTGSLEEPEGINAAVLKPLVAGFDDVKPCENILERSICAARTFRRRPEACIVPVSEISEDFNFNTETKRIIDDDYEPSFDDNVKQDSSIDVYGRASEDEFADEIKRLADS